MKMSMNNAKLKKTAGKLMQLRASEGYDGKIRLVSFNLPAIKACPGAGACKGVCYATQGRIAIGSAAAVREQNHHDSQVILDLLGPAALAVELEALVQASKPRKGQLWVRIHDSGDLYSQSYIDAWVQVIKAMPEVSFYAYTKSLHLDLSELEALPNMMLVQSVGGKHDSKIDKSKPHSRIFTTHEDRIKAGYLDGNESDMPAMMGETNIGLVYHGTRKMTDAQQRFFAVA